ncbi:MAG: tRNA lysidine(34) synthetase TilS [Candidatus Eremiobacterota bacterium]
MAGFMKDTFLDKLKAYILKEHLTEDGDRIAIAVSGGIDSVVMLDALYKLAGELNIKIGIIHFHHNVRPYGCKVDALFVENVAKEKKLPFIMSSAYVPDIAKRERRSLEETGRSERYAFFSSLIKEGKWDKIALAHTSDDQEETFFMRLLKGAGPKGLSGMAPVRDGIYIRPLLNTGRKEIELYAERYRLCYREDQTNWDQNFLRSRIRHRLIPLLKKDFNPNLSEGLERTIHIFKKEDEFLDSLAEKSLKIIIIHNEDEELVLNAERLKHYNLALKRRILRIALFNILNNSTDVDYDYTERIIKLLTGETGKLLELPGLTIRKSYGTLIFSKNFHESEPVLYEKSLAVPGETISEFFGIKVKIEIMDYSDISYNSPFKARFDGASIKGPLILRNRRKGDKFIPLGMKGKKKLKDFLIDEKIPGHKRDSIPVITSGEDILWVVGMRIDDRFKVTRKSKKIIHMEIVSSE